jgi:L-fucose isomerase-like protein
MLNNVLVPGGCEADVGGTVSMLVLRLLSDQSTVLMDLPRFDITDNSLMIWHCGTAPFDMANKRGPILERHYFSDYSDDPGLKDTGPIVDVVFRPADMTVFRLTGEADSFYYFTGRFTDTDKKTFNGSRGWVTDLKLYREPIKVLDLMNTIMTHAWAHHYPMVLTDVSGPLEELAYWLDLKRVKKAEYRDYLSVE